MKLLLKNLEEKFGNVKKNLHLCSVKKNILMKTRETLKVGDIVYTQQSWAKDKLQSHLVTKVGRKNLYCNSIKFDLDLMIELKNYGGENKLYLNEQDFYDHKILLAKQWELKQTVDRTHSSLSLEQIDVILKLLQK